MVTVCVITHDNYWLSRYSIENMITKANGINIELLIVDNGSTDEKIIDYGREVADQHIELSAIRSNSHCYNEMLKTVKTDWICIFPIGMMVNHYWLTDLFREIELIDNAGIAAINAYGDRGILNPLLTINETMEHVRCTFEGDLSGVFLFHRTIVKGIGGFDETIMGEGLEQRQFALRVKRAGKHTFYLQNQFAVDLMDRENKNDSETLWKFQQNIEQLKESKQYKVELV